MQVKFPQCESHNTSYTTQLFLAFIYLYVSVVFKKASYNLVITNRLRYIFTSLFYEKLRCEDTCLHLRMNEGGKTTWYLLVNHISGS